MAYVYFRDNNGEIHKNTPTHPCKVNALDLRIERTDTKARISEYCKDCFLMLD